MDDDKDIPIDEFVPQTNLANIINDYISMYPEDAPKWVRFLKGDHDDPSANRQKLRRLYQGYRNTPEQLDAIIQELEYPMELDETKTISPEEGCIECKRTWASTESQPTIEYLCGHKFHTVCFSVFYDRAENIRCPVEGCEDNSISRIGYRINQERRKRERQMIDVVANTILQRPDFKEDLKGMKRQISEVIRSHSKYNSEIKKIRQRTIHKHIHSINYIQQDVNNSVKQAGETEQAIALKRAVSLYRRKANHLFRKYHISFRDLRENNLIKAPWRIRFILEHHRTMTLTYKFGIRIMPGKGVWKDNV